MKPCLQLQQISKSYANRKIIHQLSFTFYPGCYCIVGSNGIGKSTILEMLSGIETLDHGQILLHTTKPLKSETLEYKKQLCYIPSNPQFFSNATAQDFIDFVFAAKNPDAKFSNQNLKQLIDQFKLSDYLSSRFDKLSLGTQKKLFLTTIAMANHSLIVLDEPTNGLDQQAIQIFVELLQQLSPTTIIIIVSHDPDVLTPLAPHFLHLTQSPIQQFVLSEENACYS